MSQFGDISQNEGSYSGAQRQRRDIYSVSILINSKWCHQCLLSERSAIFYPNMVYSGSFRAAVFSRYRIINYVDLNGRFKGESHLIHGWYDHGNKSKIIKKGAFKY